MPGGNAARFLLLFGPFDDQTKFAAVRSMQFFKRKLLTQGQAPHSECFRVLGGIFAENKGSAAISLFASLRRRLFL